MTQQSARVIGALHRQDALRGISIHTGFGSAPDPGSSPPSSPPQSTESVTGAAAGPSGNDKPRRSISSVIADLSSLPWSAKRDGSAFKARYCASSSRSDQASIGRSRLFSTPPPASAMTRISPPRVALKPAPSEGPMAAASTNAVGSSPSGRRSPTPCHQGSRRVAGTR